MDKQGFLLIEEDEEYAGISKDVLIRINPKSKFKDSFCLTWGQGCMILAKIGLSAAQHNILLILIAEMEYENFCYVSQSFISKELGISQPNVSKNIKILADHNLIFRENTKRGKAVRVNCRIAWKGNKSKSFNIAFAKDSEYEIV